MMSDLGKGTKMLIKENCLRHLKHFSILIMVFIAVFAPVYGNNIESSESFIQTFSNQIISIVDNNSTVDEKQDQLLNLFKKNSSTLTISRAALGVKWRTLTKNNKEEFSKAFTHYLVRKYGKQFEEFSNAKLIVERSIDAGKRGVLVHTRLIMPATAPISVKWQVWQKNETIKIIDIIIEDISMLTMEREEIKNRLKVHNNNILALINDLKQS